LLLPVSGKNQSWARRKSRWLGGQVGKNRIS
jgi:hypothetical protein